MRAWDRRVVTGLQRLPLGLDPDDQFDDGAKAEGLTGSMHRVRVCAYGLRASPWARTTPSPAQLNGLRLVASSQSPRRPEGPKPPDGVDEAEDAADCSGKSQKAHDYRC